MDRREKIINIIKQNKKPISASALSKELGVSRQAIVGDVALIRASGTPITATPRGYILDEKESQNIYTIALNHVEEDVQDELYTIVDLGGHIIDVIVEHPIYGQLTGKLHITSRYDVDQFMEKVKTHNALPLSQLTNGLHLHTIQCSDKQIYNRIVEALDKKEYLFKK